MTITIKKQRIFSIIGWTVYNPSTNLPVGIIIDIHPEINMDLHPHQYDWVLFVLDDTGRMSTVWASKSRVVAPETKLR